MKRMLVLLALLVGMMMGCSGMVSTHKEQARRYRTIVNIDMRQIVDDWDYFWLADRPMYLSYWYYRGNGE